MQREPTPAQKPSGQQLPNVSPQDRQMPLLQGPDVQAIPLPQQGSSMPPHRQKPLSQLSRDPHGAAAAAAGQHSSFLPPQD